MSPDGANISLGTRKFTNLAVGTAAADTVRLDQTFLLIDLAARILGTALEITVTDNGDETITLSLPPAIKLDGATASRLLGTDASKLTTSIADLSAWVKGDGTFITSTDDGAGGTDLDFIADYSDISTNDAATDVSGAELEELTDGSTTTLHFHDLTIVTHSADYTLTTTDLRKIHIFDTTSGPLRATLPSVDASDISKWVAFGRKGTNTLNIWRADSDNLVLTGGQKVDNSESRYLSLITFILYEATYWGIGNYNFGVWNVR